MAKLFGRRDPLAEAVRALEAEAAGGPAAQLPPELAGLVGLLRARAAKGIPQGEELGAQELLQAIPDAAGIFGADGRLRTGNAALDALVGGAGAAVGRSAVELARSAELAEAVSAALRGEARRLEVALPTQRRTWLAHLSPLSRGQALLVLRDLTEAKRMEGARRDFVANASHELRTPVAAIAGAAETLLGGALDLSPDARSFAEMIARHAERLSRLTQDLLDLSRLEAGEWRIEIAPLEVEPVARGSVDLLRAKAEAKRIALELAVPEGLKVLADRRALEQVLVNLLDNAVKYTPAGGKVALNAERDGDVAVLSVIDTGSGIEPRHLGRLFERFYRVDPGRSRDAGGTGLGLAIVKHLSQAQGGTVGVESGQGGSRFWVRLRALSEK